MAIATLTAGLKCPPDNLPPTRIAIVRAKPIAKGSPIAKMTNTKKAVPNGTAFPVFLIQI